MLSQNQHSQLGAEPRFNEPRKRRRRTVEKCTYCRNDRRPCSYSENNTWPVNQCLRCWEQGLKCSKPEVVGRTKALHESSPHQHEASIGLKLRKRPLARPTEHPATLQPSGLTERATDQNCKHAIILLSLHEVLMMAVEELLNLTTDMVRPFQRHPKRESSGDSIAELVLAVDGLKRIARLFNSKMREAVALISGTMFSDAQNALITLYFRRDLSWGTDHSSVAECCRTITQFQQLGHTSLAYVLQIRLLQAGIALSEADVKIMVNFRHDFVLEVDKFLNTVPPCLKGYQMFMPKEVVRIPCFAAAICADDRPDYLGRSVTQVMIDAGAPIEYPTHLINHSDALGRTILHQAVHRGDVSTVRELLRRRPDLDRDRTCLNKLSLLHIAACRGHMTMVDYLLIQAPRLLNMPDGAGRTPFWYAARSSHFIVIKRLGRDPRVDIDQKDDDGLSPTAVAARDGRHELLGQLLKLRSERRQAGTMSGEASVDHWPLLLASHAKHTECVDLILTQRSWTPGDTEYYRLLGLAKKYNDFILKGKVQAMMFGDQYGVLAGARKFESAGKEATVKSSSLPKVPYESGPLSWDNMPYASLADSLADASASSC